MLKKRLSSNSQLSRTQSSFLWFQSYFVNYLLSANSNSILKRSDGLFTHRNRQPLLDSSNRTDNANVQMLYGSQHPSSLKLLVQSKWTEMTKDDPGYHFLGCSS